MSRVTAAVADVLTIGEPVEGTAESRESPQIRALVQAARAGDRDAFGDLVVLHQRLVFRTALAALGRREDAEDTAQEAFVVAWRKLTGFRGDAMFRTWLLTIVWRKALDKRRQRQLWWRRTEAPSPQGEDPLDHLVGAAADPERHAISRDRARRIAAQIRQLTPKLKDTLLLASSGEHSYEEISQILGVPLGTVKWRVAEARRVVQARLLARGEW